MLNHESKGLKIIYPNHRGGIQLDSSAEFQPNDKFTQTNFRGRSIGINSGKIKNSKPRIKAKPKITRNIEIPRFIDPQRRGNEQYRWLPAGVHLKIKKEEYEPKLIPGDPINEITYTRGPTYEIEFVPMESVRENETMEQYFERMKYGKRASNRDDIYECPASSKQLSHGYKLLGHVIKGVHKKRELHINCKKKKNFFLSCSIIKIDNVVFLKRAKCFPYFFLKYKFVS